MKKLRLNVNNTVLVKLTPKGRTVLFNFHNRKKHEKLLTVQMEADENDEMFTKFQLWELMEIFGPQIGMGLSPCFEMDIIVKLPDDIEVENA